MESQVGHCKESIWILKSQIVTELNMGGKQHAIWPLECLYGFYQFSPSEPTFGGLIYPFNSQTKFESEDNSSQTSCPPKERSSDAELSTPCWSGPQNTSYQPKKPLPVSLFMPKHLQGRHWNSLLTGKIRTFTYFKSAPKRHSFGQLKCPVLK